MAVPSLSSSKFRSGFSLVELLVVCGAIGLFSATIFPFVQKTFKRTERIKCASNWRTFGQALYQYTLDHDGRLPKSEPTGNADQDVQLHLLPYLYPNAREADALKVTSKILCPARKWGYGFNSFVSETRLVTYSKAGDMIYGIDLCNGGRWIDDYVLTTKTGDLKRAVPKPHLGQVNVLWLDGHVSTETVSKLRNVQVTRDTDGYKVSDETTFLGEKRYDK